MGIQDRDYMRRPPPDEDRGRGRRRSPAGRGNPLLDFYEKHPRFLLYVGLGLLGLVVIGLSIVKATGGGR